MCCLPQPICASRIAILIVLVAFINEYRAEPLIDKNHTMAAKIASFQKSFITKASNFRFTPPSGQSGEGPLTVDIYLHILDRFVVDTHEHSITFSMMFCSQWTDSRLMWEKDSAPTSSIYTYWVYVWSPRIEFSNVLGAESTVSVPILVDSTGSVMKCRIYDIIAPCSFDLSDFPRDVHNCSFSFANREHGGDDVLIFDPYITDSEIVLSQWKLSPFVRAVNASQLSGANRSMVELQIQVKREPHLYGTCVYLELWTSLALLAFTLLAPENRRMPLSYIVLFATTLQHGYLSTLVKGSTATPRIIWLSSTIVAVCLATVCSSHLQSGLRSKSANPLEARLKLAVPVFDRFVLLPVTGLLAVILVFQ